MKKVWGLGMTVLLSLSVLLVACGEAGSSDLAISNAPDAVKGLKAVAYPGFVLLTWETSMNADKYSLYRTGPDGTVISLGDLASNIVWVKDTVNTTTNPVNNNILEHGKNYTYTVVSYNNNAGGNPAKATVSVTANIPPFGTNIGGATNNDNNLVWKNTGDDITVEPYYVGTGAGTPVPNYVKVTFKNLNPLFTYQIQGRQSTQWLPGTHPSADGGQVFNIQTLTPFQGTSGLNNDSTMTFTVQLQGTAYNISQHHRAYVRYDLRDGTYYTITINTAVENRYITSDW